MVITRRRRKEPSKSCQVRRHKLFTQLSIVEAIPDKENPVQTVGANNNRIIISSTEQSPPDSVSHQVLVPLGVEIRRRRSPHA
jgi:hypothetical protein